MVIGDILDRNLWRFGSRPALGSTGKTLTFNELGERSFRLANALAALGLKKGDAVAFLFPHNMIEAQEVVFSLAIAGIPAVPLNARLSTHEKMELMNKCRVKALFVEETYAAEMLSLRPGMETVKILIGIGGCEGEGLLGYEKTISAASADRPRVRVEEDDLAALIHTSGTTGMPKEVMWSHKSWLAGVRDVVIKFQLTEKDKLLMFTPYYHIPFFWFNMAVYYMGGSIFLIPAPDPALILEAIAERGITTVSHFVPTTLLRILNFAGLENYDLSSVRWFMYGGAPMPLPLLEEAFDKLGRRFIQLYGFTELAGCATALPPEDHRIHGSEKEKRRILSCGKEMPSCDIRVIRDNGTPAMPEEEGEIIYRGDNLMTGYWEDREEEEKVLSDGWFRTGDLGFIDDDRYIYITGRKKDVIISGGENITPKQVEDIIYRHPSVESVAVIGVPDPVWGEAVKACVVLKKRHEATEEEIIALCKENLARYKAPKSVDFLSDLPVTPTGKIKKWELRKRYGLKP